MEYRAKAHLELLTWLLMNVLTWIGVIGIAWNLLKPGGWLYWIVDLIVANQPTSLYYLAVGMLGLLAGKVWIDNIDPSACNNLLAASAAFAGTIFILNLLLPL
jgi:hypothetical protein